MDLFPALTVKTENEGLLDAEKVTRPHNDDDREQGGNQPPPSQSNANEQLGGGYGFRMNPKSTPKAEQSKDADLQRIVLGRAANPDCVSLPPINFIEGDTYLGGPEGTGWEQVDPSILADLANKTFDPMQSDSETSQPSTPLGTPTPRPRRLVGLPSDNHPIRHTTPPTVQANNTSDGRSQTPDGDNDIENDAAAAASATANNWDAGWNSDDKAAAATPTAGRRSNIKRDIIQRCFKDVRDCFRQAAAKTGCSASALEAEYHNSLTTGVKPSSWRKYEVFFKYNKEQEQERHRDADGNKVPNAKANDCWSTFKLLPNYRQILDTYRELQLTSSDQTLCQRRRDFDTHFAKICKTMDVAYENKFEGVLYFVGNCINADTSLGSFYTTPGLTEFASRLGCADDNEVLSYAKTEAYHSVAKGATNELIQKRKKATKDNAAIDNKKLNKGGTYEESSDNDETLSSTLPSRDRASLEPAHSKLTADELRSCCKEKLFDMFEEFGISLKKASSMKKEGGGGGKGKAKANADLGTSSVQMPWSTLPCFLEEEGVQLCAWPFGVDPPCNITKQGIKSLSAWAACQLLSALTGETDEKPFLRRTDPAVASKDKFPVILTTAPPSDSKKTNGDVVLNDATLNRNCRKHGLPRRASAATSVKGKVQPGKASNPITVSSASPPGHETRSRKKPKSKKIVISDDENNNSDDDDDVHPISRPLHQQAAVHARSSHDDDANPISRPLHQQGAVHARSSHPKPMAQASQVPPDSTTANDEEDDDWEATIRRLKKQKVSRAAMGKTTAEIMDEERARAQKIIAQATANISEKTSAASAREDTPRRKAVLSKPVVLITTTPPRSTKPSSAHPPPALAIKRAPPPTTSDIGVGDVNPPPPTTADGNTDNNAGVAVAPPPPAAAIPQSATSLNVTTIPSTSSLNQLKRDASAVDNNANVPITTKKPRLTPETSPAADADQPPVPPPTSPAADADQPPVPPPTSPAADADQPPVPPPCPTDVNVPSVKMEAVGLTPQIPPPAPHHTRPSPAPEPFYHPQPSWYPHLPPPPSHQPSPVPEALNAPNTNANPRADHHNWYPPPPPPPSHQPPSHQPSATPKTTDGKGDEPTSHHSYGPPPPPWKNSMPYYPNYGYYPPPPPGAYHYSQRPDLESSHPAPPSMQEGRPPASSYPPYYPSHGPYGNYGHPYGAPQPQSQFPPYGPPPGQWQAPPAPPGAPHGEQGASQGSSHAPGTGE